MNQILLSKTKCWKCDSCLINNRAICRASPKEAFEELNRISKIRRYSKGHVIIGQGEEASIVGNVVSGIVKVQNSFEDGRQQIVGLMFPSDFFGRVYKGHSRFSFEAATDVVVCAIARHDFENLLLRHSEIEHELLITIFDELDAMREWVALISCRTTMQRVATFLRILANRDRTQDCRESELHGDIVIDLPIGRRDIATYLGTTPETLSRNIQSLSRKNVIRILNAKQFELLDLQRLAHYAGDEHADEEIDTELAATMP
jgi:CRP/FNR family transcriptional regulator